MASDLSVEEKAAFLLEKTEWGGELSPEEALAAASKLVSRRFAAGETVFREGESGDFKAFIVSGKVDIVKKNVYFRKKIVAVLGEGDIFGEIALIDGSERSAAAVCSQECHLLTLSREGYQELVAENPALGFKVLNKLANLICRRLRETTRLYVDMEGDAQARTITEKIPVRSGEKPWMRRLLRGGQEKKDETPGGR